MLDFKPLSLDHASVVKEYFALGRTRLCDQSMGGCFMWRNGFSILGTISQSQPRTENTHQNHIFQPNNIFIFIVDKLTW